MEIYRKYFSFYVMILLFCVQIWPKLEYVNMTVNDANLYSVTDFRKMREESIYSDRRTDGLMVTFRSGSAKGRKQLLETWNSCNFIL